MAEIIRTSTNTTTVNSEGGVLNMLRTRFTNLSKRGQIGLEIFTSERAYCKVLEDTIKFYLVPLRNGAVPLLRKPLLPIIFLNIEEILAMNALFLKELEYCVYAPSFSEKGEIAPAFEPLLKALGCYSSYVKNHWRAIVEVNKLEKKDKEFVQFLAVNNNIYNIYHFNYIYIYRL